MRQNTLEITPCLRYCRKFTNYMLAASIQTGFNSFYIGEAACQKAAEFIRHE
jgi:hypothetical protein